MPGHIQVQEEFLHWKDGLPRDVVELPSKEALRKWLHVALSAVVWLAWWCLVKAWTQLWESVPALMISWFQGGIAWTETLWQEFAVWFLAQMCDAQTFSSTVSEPKNSVGEREPVHNNRCTLQKKCVLLALYIFWAYCTRKPYEHPVWNKHNTNCPRLKCCKETLSGLFKCWINVSKYWEQLWRVVHPNDHGAPAWLQLLLAGYIWCIICVQQQMLCKTAKMQWLCCVRSVICDKFLETSSNREKATDSGNQK